MASIAKWLPSVELSWKQLFGFLLVLDSGLNLALDEVRCGIICILVGLDISESLEHKA